MIAMNMASLRQVLILMSVVLIGIVGIFIFVEYYQEPIFEIIQGNYQTFLTIQDNNKPPKDTSNNRGENDNFTNTPEERILTPEMQLFMLCKNWNTGDQSKTTNPDYSKMTLDFINDDSVITVSIHTYDMLNRSSTHGYDVIVILALEKNGDGRVAGEVIDHRNGSYTGIMKPFWSGPTLIKAELASSVVNTCLRMKAIKKYGNAVFAMEKGWGIRGKFENDKIKESTPCGGNPMIFGFIEICNLTDINGGMSWYCGKPKTDGLQCSNLTEYRKEDFNTSWVSPQEIIQNPGHGVFQSELNVNVSSPFYLTPEVPCKDSAPEISWENNVPSGVWINGSWRMTKCQNHPLKHLKHYRKCLSGKTIFLVGDSTIRQYAEVIQKGIMRADSNFAQHNMGVIDRYLNFEYMFKKHEITLRYIQHEMPFHNSRGISSLRLKSIPQLLDSLATENISNLVVLVDYSNHFSIYPPDVYRHRQRELKNALHKFSLANPSSKLFVKTPHLVIDDIHWFDPRVELLEADILREEFSGLNEKVVLLDTWTISVTLESERLHPENKAVYSQVQQFLSYIC